MGLFGINDQQRREMAHANKIISEAERQGFAGTSLVVFGGTEGMRDKKRYQYTMAKMQRASEFLDNKSKQTAREAEAKLDSLEKRHAELKAKVEELTSNAQEHPISDDAFSRTSSKPNSYGAWTGSRTPMNRVAATDSPMSSGADNGVASSPGAESPPTPDGPGPSRA